MKIVTREVKHPSDLKRMTILNEIVTQLTDMYQSSTDSVFQTVAREEIKNYEKLIMLEKRQSAKATIDYKLKSLTSLLCNTVDFLVERKPR